jgi:hypothetical protein
VKNARPRTNTPWATAALEKLDESGQLRLPDSDEGEVDVDDDVSLRVGQSVATEPAVAENGRTS